jgi:general nucleoside transport system ATP-binding protein
MKIDLLGIHKYFGKVHANNDIYLTIASGSIHGLLGENGAGKSTLMKILSGYIRADRGEIILDGKISPIYSPSNALSLGIGMLHQDPLDFPPMKVIDNFITGSRIKNNLSSFFLDHQSTRKQFVKLQHNFNFELDPESYVDTLTVGERQQLEILRLIWLGARILILDEPTTGISLPQKILLFNTLKQLARDGMTILFVTHKLEDVNELCDDVSVLRQGQLVGQESPPFDIDHLVNLMFGKPVERTIKESCKKEKRKLHIKNISYEDQRTRLRDVSLEVMEGEVIGIAGMEGSGQLEFLRICSGLIRPTQGNIIFDDMDLSGKNYLKFHKNGFYYLPASRLEEGLVSGLSLTDHFLLTTEKPGFFIDYRKGKNTTEKAIKDFYIHGLPENSVEMLSGGNQQRTLLALMGEDTQVILMEHPTRGLDVESSRYIWTKLKERCRKGACILFISSDLEEILDYSDRVLVFYSGKISDPLGADTTNSEILGQLIGGKGWTSKF